MTSETLRLKNDVLNDLRNTKYYTEDELRLIVANTTLSQKEKVSRVIEMVGELVNIDTKIATVENIFRAPEPAPDQQPVVNDTVENTPDNIVEPQLNQQGQSHSE